MYNNFLRLITEKRVTPYRVAKDTGIATATLTAWKNGDYVPKVDKLKKIADYLGVSIEELLCEKEESDGRENHC